MRLDPFVSSAGREGCSQRPPERRLTMAPRSFRAPGMGFGHELLVALIMAVAMAATVLLYR